MSTVSKDHYYRLASEHPGERIEAVSKLVTELAEVNTKEDWDYALNRLVKGLITSRQSARFGFSMALTEVVRELVPRQEYPDITIDSFLDLVMSTTQVRAGMKGKEERSVLFGRLFGLQILVNSQVLFNNDVVDEEVLLKFVTCLIELSNMKSWLRETTIFTVCQFIKLILGDSTEELSSELKEKVLVHILQITNDEGINLSTEGIAIYLSIPNPQRVELSSQVVNPKANWKNNDPLSKGNLPVLAKALKDVEIVETEDDSENKKLNEAKKKGNWSPRLPFVWDLIIENFRNKTESDEDEDETETTPSKKRKKSSKKSSKKHKSEDTQSVKLEEFWKVVVDETLFSDKSSNERKFWGFELFLKFVDALTVVEDVQYLLTKNFLRCLINHSSQANRFLNKISHLTLKKLVDVSKDNYLKAPIILSRLLNEDNGGCWNFDLLTKSKTVDGLLTVLNTKKVDSVNEVEVALVLQQFKDLLVGKFKELLELAATPEIKSNDSVLRWYMDKLILLVRNSKHLFTSQSQNYESVEDILKLFIRYGFFTKTEGVVPSYAKICQDKLNSLLSDVITVKRKESSSWAYFCVKYIIKLEGSNKQFSLTKFDEEIGQVRDEGIATLQSIHGFMKASKSSEKAEQFYCFELLFSMVLIQLYMGDDEAVTVMTDLKFCYESTFLGKDGEDDEDKNTEVTSDIVLIEIILSFLARNASLLKKFSSIVWESFLCGKNETTGKLTLQKEGLQLLFDVLVAKENKAGQEKLFEDNPEIEIDDDEESDQGSDADSEESDKSEESDSEIEDIVEDDEKEENADNALTALDKETNLKLAKALGIPTAHFGDSKLAESGSSGDEDSDYESDSMDDEQMMQMDGQLSKIFKERHEAISSITTGSKRKSEALEAREHMIFFKSRILDLLEIFNKINPQSYLNLTILQPLVTLINMTLDKNLGVKAHKLLKTKISKTRVSIEELKLYFPTNEEQTKYKDSLLKLIRDLQTEASTKSSNQSHSLACNHACIIVSKNLIALDPEYSERVIDLYATCLKEWALNPRSKIQASMFFDFINWLNAKKSNKN